MTDRNQFEAMLEALINEDQETAKEIFHNIVVAKSREIYEELLSEDFDVEESKDEEEEEENVDEAFGEEEEGAEDAGEEEGEEGDVGGDATDDMIDDVEDGEDEEMSDEEQSDRILDLEDALEELKAEFEQLMAGEEGAGDELGGDELGGDEFGGDELAGDEFGGEEEELENLDQMFEYVNKVSPPKHGDNGANTKSIVAKKNDMGGTTANIAKSFSTEKGGTQGGLLNPSTKEENFGNINVPGGKAGKSAFKKREPGHGAESKGKGEQADNKKSLIGGK